MQYLYLFNPDNEISIANGTNGYTPKANISIMAGDLAYLSAYLSGEGITCWFRKYGGGFYEKREGKYSDWIVNLSCGKRPNYFLFVK